MMSVVCVYNDKKTLENFLLKGLKNQDSQDYELILVDNRENSFKSAAAALNYGYKKTKSNYIVFIHQDILLPPNWFKNTEKLVDNLDNPGIVGVAGKVLGNNNILTNIEHGVPPSRPSNFESIDKPLEVNTVDECLFIIPRKVFNENSFDEKCCDGWHFYASDYCLSAKSRGYTVYTIPSVLYHKSAGGFSNYFGSMEKFLNKYAHDLIIPTTCGNWLTEFSYLNHKNPHLKNSIINTIVNDDIDFNSNVKYEEYFSKLCENEILKNKIKISNIKIKESNLDFDRNYYLKKYSDVKKVDIDPFEHYTKYGIKKNRFPNQKLENIGFNRNYYLNKYPEVKDAKMDPAEHYIMYGEMEGRYPNKKMENIKLDKKYYLKKYPDVKKAGIDPIEHYIKHGEKEGRYTKRTDAIKRFIYNIFSIFPHVYILYKIKEYGLKNTLINLKAYNVLNSKTPFFNEKYYLIHYPNIKNKGLKPLLHYMFHGFKENKNPNPKFNSKFYINHNKDVKKSKLNPLVHYVLYGQYELRNISNKYSNVYLNESQITKYYNLIKNSKEFDEKWYLNKYPESKKLNMDPIVYYLRIGSIKMNDPNPNFKSKEYIKLNFPKRKEYLNPFTHYLEYGKLEGRRINFNFSDYVCNFLYKIIFNVTVFNFFKIILPLREQVLFFSTWSKPNEQDILHENSRIVYDKLDAKKVVFARKNMYSRDKINIYFKTLLSKVIVIDSGFFLLNTFKLRGTQRVIQIWHACGAFKKIAFDLKGLNKKTIEILNNQFSQYNSFIVSSENIRSIYANAHNIDKEIVKPLGVPRTDLILDENYRKKVSSEFYIRNSHLKNKNIILYCPTLRDGRVFNPEINWKKLNDSLDDNTVFIIKRHIMTSNDILNGQKYSKIMYLEDESTYTLMFVSKMMVTDYSSVIFEYSLLEKPIIHYCPDYETYIKDRDFYLDFDNELYGEIVFNDDKLIKTIQKLLNDNNNINNNINININNNNNNNNNINNINNNINTDKLFKFKEKYMDECDGKSTDRIVNLIKHYMDENTIIKKENHEINRKSEKFRDLSTKKKEDYNNLNCLDPIKPSINYGKKQGRYPNQKLENIQFDEKYYLNKYSDVKLYGLNPIKHFIKYGKKQGRYPNQKLENIQFDEKYYLNKYSDVKKAKFDPIEHYLKHGEKEGRYPNQKIENIQFDRLYYLKKYPDVKNMSIDPIEHYLTCGKKEGRYPNQKLEDIQFDKDYYLERNLDVKLVGADPIGHYIIFGEKQGRYDKFVKTNKTHQNNNANISSGIKEEILTNEEYKKRCDERKSIIKQNQASLINPKFNEQPMVSIIILNKDGYKNLKILFNNFENTIGYKNYEIIVVDNGSIDDSLQFLEKLSEKLPLKILRNNINKSFSQANNQGARKAKGKYLLLLNNDIEPTNGWLNEMMGIMLNNQNVGSVGAKLVYPHHREKNEYLRIQHAGVCFWSTNYFPYHLLIFKPLLDEKIKTEEFPCVTAAVLLIKKSVYEEVNGLDENYVYGFEDVDLGLKLLKKGYKNILCSTALLFHDESTTIKKTSFEIDRRYSNYKLLHEKWREYLFENIFKEKLNNVKFLVREPLKIGFIVSEIGDNPERNDFFIAFELSKELEKLGYKTTFISCHSKIEAPDVDVLINLLPDFKISDIKPRWNTILIAWMKNCFNEWTNNSDFNKYNIYLSSSTKFCKNLSETLDKKVYEFPVATNPSRFSQDIICNDYKSDYCLIGNYNNFTFHNIVNFLNPEKLNYDFAIFGENWEKIDKFKQYVRDKIDYFNMPQVYSSTKLVIDETNYVDKKYNHLNSVIFDTIASKRMVITNSKIEGNEIFNGILPFYSSEYELNNLIKFYLENDNERNKKINELNEFVLKNHTYKNRALKLKEILELYIDEGFHDMIDSW